MASAGSLVEDAAGHRFSDRDPRIWAGPLLVLHVEKLDQIKDEIGRIVAALLDRDHFDQVGRRDEQEDLLVFAINRVPLDMGLPLRRLVGAQYRQSPHRLRQVIACLIDLIFSNFAGVVVFELEEDHPRIELLIEMGPIAAAVVASVRENGVAPVDTRIASWLDDRLRERRDEQVAECFGASVLEFAPSTVPRFARAKPGADIIRGAHLKR